MFRRTLFACAAIAVAAVLGACAPAKQGTARTADSAPLRVGLTANYPPIVFREDGALRGVEIDLANELGPALGRPVELVELPWEDLIPALVEERIDIIMSGMSITARRAEKVRFTESYLQVGQMAVIRLSDVERLGNPAALIGFTGRVGFVDNTTGAAFVQSALKDASPVGYRDTDAGLAALEAGAIDVFVHDAPTVWRVGAAPEHQALMGLFWPLTEEYLAWAVRPSDQELLAAVNASIETWREDGRLRETLRRWIPVRVEVK